MFPPAKTIWQWFLAAAASYLACRIGLIFRTEGHPFSIVWPGNGLLLGALLVSSRRSWPPILWGAAAGNLAAGMQSGNALGVACGFSFINVAEAVAGAWLVERLRPRPVRLESPGDVFVLYLAPTFSVCGLAALGGAAVSRWGLGGPDLWTGWFTWWVADSIGVLMIMPLIVAWSQAACSPRLLPASAGITRSRILEATVQFASVCVFSLLIHGAPVAGRHILFHRPFLTLPLLALGGNATWPARDLGLAAGRVGQRHHGRLAWDRPVRIDR